MQSSVWESSARLVLFKNLCCNFHTWDKLWVQPFGMKPWLGSWLFWTVKNCNLLFKLMFMVTNDLFLIHRSVKMFLQFLSNLEYFTLIARPLKEQQSWSIHLICFSSIMVICQNVTKYARTPASLQTDQIQRSQSIMIPIGGQFHSGKKLPATCLEFRWGQCEI